MKQILPFFLILLLAAASCKKHSAPAGAAIANSNATMIADTIIYQVLIKNPNPEDKWAEKCLQGLNRKAMLDSIFNMVYRGKLSAYDQVTNEKMTIRQVKDLESEKGYSRDKIDKIQFTEAWYFDSGRQTMNKKVLSMVIAYDVYTPEGDLIGPKPVFRIDMK